MARRRQKPRASVVTLADQGHALIWATAIISARAAWPLVARPPPPPQPEAAPVVSESPCDLKEHAYGALEGVRSGLVAGEQISSVAFYWLRSHESMMFKVFDSDMDPNRLFRFMDPIAPVAWCTGVVYVAPKEPSIKKEVTVRFESLVDGTSFLLLQEFSLDNDSWPVLPLPEAEEIAVREFTLEV